ncbi:MAG: S8 family peptidase [Chthoniobacterales bacterium]
MKLHHYFILCLAITLASIPFIKNAKHSIFSNSLKNNAPAISMITSVEKSDESSLPEPSQKKDSSLIPPYNQISDDELAEFPGATLVESGKGRGPKPDETLQVRVLKTNFKDPYVRTEVVLNKNTGNIVSRREMAADQLLVTLPKGMNEQAFIKWLNIPGVSITSITPSLSRLHFPSHASTSLQEIMKRLQENGLSTEPDIIYQQKLIDNTENVTTQWALSNSDGGVDAIDAWSIISQTPSIIIAIVDTGIRYTHQALAGNMWHNIAPTFGDVYGINAYANNGNPMDDNGHGTHCAGTIGGINNYREDSIRGVTQKVQLMACKYSDANGVGLTSDAISCIDYALIHGAKIINCSWGSPDNSPGLYQELQKAQAQGVIIVAAAGNDALNDDQGSFYPASYKLDNVITVAATTPGDDFAYFSNYGPTSVSLAAPGLNIYSAYADADDSYAIMSGTSMAAPYVTGTLALLEAKFPKDAYKKIVSRLLTSTDHLPILDGRTKAGRLNIAKAVSQP